MRTTDLRGQPTREDDRFTQAVDPPREQAHPQQQLPPLDATDLTARAS